MQNSFIIKALVDHKGIVKDKEYEVSEQTGNTLSELGLAEFVDPKMKAKAPKPKPKRGRKPKEEVKETE